jgi:hypothetical protein
MIYVAASSAEIERAEKWMGALRKDGIRVTSIWPETIRRVQAERALALKEACNPKVATVTDRRTWSMENVNAVCAAEVFWLLVPPLESPSQGAYFEFAVAWRERKLTFASGGDQRFVFTSLACALFEQDDYAFDAIRAVYRHRKAG